MGLRFPGWIIRSVVSTSAYFQVKGIDDSCWETQLDRSRKYFSVNSLEVKSLLWNYHSICCSADGILIGYKFCGFYYTSVSIAGLRIIILASLPALFPPSLFFRKFPSYCHQTVINSPYVEPRIILELFNEALFTCVIHPIVSLLFLFL